MKGSSQTCIHSLVALCVIIVVFLFEKCVFIVFMCTCRYVCVHVCGVCVGAGGGQKEVWVC